MTEPTIEQTHHLKTSDTPSGGSGTVLEHPPANDNGGPEIGDRGRQRDKQHQAENGGRDINTDKLWQMQGGQREVCPALAAGNALPKCPVAAQPCQEPGVDVCGEGNLVAHGNSGDGPLEETLSQVQGESGIHIDSGTGTDARQGKKKHRRRPSKKKSWKRRWKPYFKLSWEEKKALDERETARASRVREEMFAKGLPVAPYNTTQFLMDEHDREEPDLNTETGGRRPPGPGGRQEDTASEEDCFDNDDEEDDGSGGGSDGIGRPGNAGGEFLQRDFSETYEKYHVESLQNMTKQELVQEYLELEKCMSRLEEENNRLRRAIDPGITVESPQPQPDPTRVKELESDVERLGVQKECASFAQPAE